MNNNIPVLYIPCVKVIEATEVVEATEVIETAEIHDGRKMT